ncbi:hypothetical protein [Alicyclobacillus suci]|uniref:hypothetical protein n=1 Tax=Alicyclobacillus suci TaxID=2816080 RepID=UPI001A90C1E2|nr:hypothetical protein [Alicyclobacillus suci]
MNKGQNLFIGTILVFTFSALTGCGNTTSPAAPTTNNSVTAENTAQTNATAPAQNSTSLPSSTNATGNKPGTINSNTAMTPNQLANFTQKHGAPPPFVSKNVMRQAPRVESNILCKKGWHPGA